MFIDKIKYKYIDNLFKKYFEQNNVNEIGNLLHGLSHKDIKKFSHIISTNLSTIVNKEIYSSIFSKNLIWVNSFEKNDCDYISKFLTYMLDQNNIKHSGTKYYHDCLLELVEEYKINNINFKDLLDNSYLYQFLLTKNNNQYKIINTSSAFFETNLKKYFTHYFFTKCFIYIVRNPIEIFSKRKKMNPQKSTIENMSGLSKAQNDYRSRYKSSNESYVEENIQDWTTNVSSWSNGNVCSTFRGYILKYEDLLNDPEQMLSEVIGHLSQAGLNIELNYSLIKSFLNDNPLLEEDKSVVVSNNEIKILRRDNLYTAQKFKYDF